MKRISFTGICILVVASMTALAPLGCVQQSDVVEEEPDSRIGVSFGNGKILIDLEGMTVTNDDAGITSISAAMISELPGLYTFEAVISSDGVLDARISDGGDISHSVHLDARSLEIEFVLPTWMRHESMGFDNAESMNAWLQTRMDAMEAAESPCDGVPEAFSEMPLHYPVRAILDQLDSTGVIPARGDGLTWVGQLDQLLCAQALDMADYPLIYPGGHAGWEALRDGQLMPTAMPKSRPAEPKFLCAREDKAVHTVGTHSVATVGTPSNLSMSCLDAALTVDASCCTEGTMDANTTGFYEHRIAPNPCAADAPDSHLQRFAFSASANACPGADAQCQPNGVTDAVAQASCWFTGFGSAPADFMSYYGGTSATGDGSAGWAYLGIQKFACAGPDGNGTDRIYHHYGGYRMTTPAGLICETDPTQCMCNLGI